MIKWILYYIQKQAEQQKNFILAKIAMALQCVVRCFERFIKFLNKNAYIQIAILGKIYFQSLVRPGSDSGFVSSPRGSS